MTGRERLNAVLRGEAKDRLPWTTLVDGATLSLLPPGLGIGNCIDFCRHIGCDVFLLNGWSTAFEFRSPELRWGPETRVRTSRQGEEQTVNWETPRGRLTAVLRRGHPCKYPVDSPEALRVYREMWEAAAYVAHDDAETFRAVDALVGTSGIVTRFWGPSTIPRLLEIDMGVENFYALYCDHPEEMDGLINLMHARELPAFGHLAAGPCSSVTLIENTSTSYISPEVYAKYNMPHQRDFVAAVHGAGKAALLHMCGHVRALLELIRETGCDGIHALTPPATGNTPWELALDVLGEDLVILGCLDPATWIAGDIRGIPAALDRLITPRLREANFVLHPFADGIPVPLERFQAVARWVERSQP